jgi:aconitate hydratase 2/2-methylisocitrate dehydratase
MEFIKKGGSYAIVFGKSYKLCFKTLGIDIVLYFPSKKFLSKDKDLLQLRKYSKKCSWNYPGKVLHAGSDVRVEVLVLKIQLV